MKRTDQPAKKKRQKKRQHTSKRTKNSAFQMFGKMPTFPIPAGSTLEIDIQNSPLDQFPGFAADLMIRSALLNATDAEKMIIAGMVPIVLKFIRGAKSVPAEATETPPGRTEETRNEVPNPDEAKL